MQEKDILIVEDHALLAMLMEEILREAGYNNIHICNSADTALRCIKSYNIEFAFLDFNLGYDKLSVPVAEKLGEKAIPFAFLSGYTSTEGIIPDGLGEVARLSKPAIREEILMCLTDQAKCL